MFILDHLRNVARSLSSPVWQFCGRDEHSGGEISILFFGSIRQHQYLINRIFGCAETRSEYIGRRSIFSLSRLAKSRNCDLAVVAAPRSHLSVIKRPEDLLIPWWIDAEIDCESVLRGNNTRSLKRDLQKVRKNNLQYFVTSAQDDVEFFYERIYGPTIRLSHGAAALPSSGLKRLEQVQSGMAELLMVTSAGERVGGLLLDYRDRMPALRDIGVLDGEIEYKKLGVISGANYFGLEHLYSLGYKKVSMGLSRCFVDDGVFGYKMKWKPRFFAPSANGFLFRVNKLNDSTRSFYESLDCIAETDGELSRVRYFRDSSRLESDDKQVAGSAEIGGVAASSWYEISGDLPKLAGTEPN